MDYPKIKSINVLENNRIEVFFENNIRKIYDCSGLLKEEPFTALKDKGLFNSAHIESGGRGIAWNDYIDLSESELWVNGKEY